MAHSIKVDVAMRLSRLFSVVLVAVLLYPPVYRKFVENHTLLRNPELPFLFLFSYAILTGTLMLRGWMRPIGRWPLLVSIALDFLILNGAILFGYYLAYGGVKNTGWVLASICPIWILSLFRLIDALGQAEGDTSQLPTK